MNHDREKEEPILTILKSVLETLRFINFNCIFLIRGDKKKNSKFKLNWEEHVFILLIGKWKKEKLLWKSSLRLKDSAKENYWKIQLKKGEN